MRKNLYKITLVILIVAAYIVLSFSIKPDSNSDDPDENYWFQGKAEITAYDLEQVRYGEVHDGESVLIYVTEDFSRTKQVKLDYPKKTPDDAVKVLKLNFTKKFFTGIYPYSVMGSVFTSMDPDYPTHTLKNVGSVQEWCGTTFTQMNMREDHYQVWYYSYFESEGDGEFSIEKAVLEDEIWTWLRIDPSKLPEGEFQIIPGIFQTRLSHQAMEIQNATASMEDLEDGQSNYTVTFTETGRILSITFSSEFPYSIESWEETMPNGLVTTAVKKARVMTDYWNKNGTGDQLWQEKLNLRYN